VKSARLELTNEELDQVSGGRDDIGTAGAMIAEAQAQAPIKIIRGR
jgi:lactobin A/cerein 7B family class IIb bacteriocin